MSSDPRLVTVVLTVSDLDFSAALYTEAFRVDDLDAAHRRAVDAGAQVVHDPVQQPWGRSARYMDPDGNIIELTEPTT